MLAPSADSQQSPQAVPEVDVEAPLADAGDERPPTIDGSPSSMM